MRLRKNWQTLGTADGRFMARQGGGGLTLLLGEGAGAAAEGGGRGTRAGTCVKQFRGPLWRRPASTVEVGRAPVGPSPSVLPELVLVLHLVHATAPGPSPRVEHE